MIKREVIGKIEAELIKEHIERGMIKGRLKKVAKELDTDFEGLYDYFVRQKSLPTAEQLVEELKNES